MINPVKMKTSLDYKTRKYCRNFVDLAPGDDRRPLDLAFEEDSEELSFPPIYCRKSKLQINIFKKALFEVLIDVQNFRFKRIKKSPPICCGKSK